MRKPGSNGIEMQYVRLNVEELRKMNHHAWATAIYSELAKGPVLLVTLLFACALCFSPIVCAHPRAAANSSASGANEQTFPTPEDATKALVVAAEAKDRVALGKIFGSDYDQLLSGDQVEDDKDLAGFAKGLQKSAKLQKVSDSKYTVLVGDKSWPMPIPLVKEGNEWHFDTKAGLNEILNRRIGEDELSAIATCRTYAVAQWEYFTEGDHDNDGVAEYAQKFMSSPGQKDGLYWPTAAGEKPSPFGQLVAEARAEGYGHKPGANAQNPKSESSTTQNAENAAQRPRHPFHGYYLKILTAQGPSAPGGEYNYIINGNMIAGFALVAYPDKWGNSGVMTFIINQQGRVYEKNLGPDTDKIASSMTEYDPDPSWQLVEP
jgi:Protein of unknown function (DUF2950)